MSEQSERVGLTDQLGVNDDGYWCVICQKFLSSNDGVVVHDDLPHPITMNFDDEEKPQ